MGLLDISRGAVTDDGPTTDSDSDGSTPTETEATGGRRRWLVLGLLVAAGVVYVLAKRHTAREAEFTEIELDPVDSESESESESASTE